MTVWTGSEVGMRHKEAIWLSSPNFYSAVKQFVEEHQCGIALFGELLKTERLKTG